MQICRAPFHELRHYYASLLIDGGEGVKVGQKRLGHASADETPNTYAHLSLDSACWGAAGHPGCVSSGVPDLRRSGTLKPAAARLGQAPYRR